MTAVRDELRSARLLLGSGAPDAELEAQLRAAPQLRAAVRSRAFPPAPVRFAQRVRLRLGRLAYEDAVAAPLQAARRAVLGAAAEAPPRFLVRVDEFPHYMAWDEPERYGTQAYRRFHQTMAGAGVPYLIAVLPRVSHAALDPHETHWRALQPDERGLLASLPADTVSFGLHGLDHRTRHASPRRHSELCGLDARETERLLEQALAELRPLELEPRVFVPPFNRFDRGQYELLARRFDVVCGGPESVALLGLQGTPLWRGEAVYMPAYHPLYGHAREILPAARRLIERRCGLWVPVVLHWGWERDEGWEALERLLALIAPYAARWQDFLGAVAASAG